MQQIRKVMGKTKGTRMGLSKLGDFQRRYKSPATLAPDTSQSAKLK